MTAKHPSRRAVISIINLLAGESQHLRRPTPDELHASPPCDCFVHQVYNVLTSHLGTDPLLATMTPIEKDIHVGPGDTIRIPAGTIRENTTIRVYGNRFSVGGTNPDGGPDRSVGVEAHTTGGGGGGGGSSPSAPDETPTKPVSRPAHVHLPALLVMLGVIPTTRSFSASRVDLFDHGKRWVDPPVDLPRELFGVATLYYRSGAPIPLTADLLARYDAWLNSTGATVEVTTTAATPEPPQAPRITSPRPCSRDTNGDGDCRLCAPGPCLTPPVGSLAYQPYRAVPSLLVAQREGSKLPLNDPRSWVFTFGDGLWNPFPKHDDKEPPS